MDTLRTLDDSLAAKFLAGETTPQEAMLVTDWIEASSENKAYFQQLQTIWALGNKVDKIPAKLTVWQSVQSKLEKKGKSVAFISPFSIAAAVIIIFTIGISLYFFKPADIIADQISW